FLNGYFDNQDRDFLTGKLQLTEEFLKTETFRNKTDIKSLSEKINDAMVGHNGLFISIKNMENEKIVELYAKNSVVPAGNDSNLLIVFYVQIMPDDFVMQLHR
ncbi:hypothetical protein VOD49_27565, partial [Enterobacter hormaechei subsp. xiangfangensis]